MNTMTQIKEANDDNGVAVRILLNEQTKKFHVIMRDVECEETVGCVICPTIELAEKYFAKMTAVGFTVAQ